ncbi:MAG: hypothetical protein M4D80_01440 [Myxococcota bacterium]|nr:hypothetical protein [Myxococcota bacterium]
MLEDLPARYHEYLERFTAKVGVHEVGAFAKWSSKLIKKLSFEEFTPAYLEYSELSEQYFASIERGDTINDVILRVLREKAATLVLDPPG